VSSGPVVVLKLHQDSFVPFIRKVLASAIGDPDMSRPAGSSPPPWNLCIKKEDEPYTQGPSLHLNAVSLNKVFRSRGIRGGIKMPIYLGSLGKMPQYTVGRF
jgi:hypothetical protein